MSSIGIVRHDHQNPLLPAGLARAPGFSCGCGGWLDRLAVAFSMLTEWTYLRVRSASGIEVTLRTARPWTEVMDTIQRRMHPEVAPEIIKESR